MLGAIYGDMVGSRFEFKGFKSKNFEMFTNSCHFTDDTLMTLAIAKALLWWDKSDIEDLKRKAIISMVDIYNKYPNTMWGYNFYHWLTVSRVPNNSCGNGAGMRVSPVGWYAISLDEAKQLAEAVTVVSHNHPEAVKGAQAIACAIYLARIGTSKEIIKEYIGNNFYPEILTMDFKKLQDSYGYVYSNEVDGFDSKYLTCQYSVPQAIMAFLASISFDDAIRNAISLGGDSDTLACMCGSIAEAYYGLTLKEENEVLSRLPDDLAGICYGFETIKKPKINIGIHTRKQVL